MHTWPCCWSPHSAPWPVGIHRGSIPGGGALSLASSISTWGRRWVEWQGVGLLTELGAFSCSVQDRDVAADGMRLCVATFLFCFCHPFFSYVLFLCYLNCFSAFKNKRNKCRVPRDPIFKKRMNSSVQYSNFWGIKLLKDYSQIQ